MKKVIKHSTKKINDRDTNPISSIDTFIVTILIIFCQLFCYIGGIFYYLTLKIFTLSLLWYILLIPTTIGTIIIFCNKSNRREIVKEFVEFWYQYKNNKIFPILEVFIK